MSDTYETVDGSKIVPANDITKYAEQLKRERDEAINRLESLIDAVNALHDFIADKRKDDPRDVAELINGAMQIANKHDA
jgi:hypothetical protein